MCYSVIYTVYNGWHTLPTEYFSHPACYIYGKVAITLTPQLNEIYSRPSIIQTLDSEPPNHSICDVHTSPQLKTYYFTYPLSKWLELIS